MAGHVHGQTAAEPLEAADDEVGGRGVEAEGADGGAGGQLEGLVGGGDDDFADVLASADEGEGGDDLVDWVDCYGVDGADVACFD